MIIVTKGNKLQPKEDKEETLKKLEMAGYVLTEKKKTEVFKRESEWSGHKIDQNGLKQKSNWHQLQSWKSRKKKKS